MSIELSVNELECLSCGEDDSKCPSPKRPCGHHCNHWVTHDQCCWCNQVAVDESDGVDEDDVN